MPEASSELEERRAAVAVSGRQVMPFDLDATTHVFEKIRFGGVQRVVADSDDPRQIALVREHLEVEAERFARGDFHDPALIHGEDMAGLHQLVLGHGRLSIEGSAQIPLQDRGPRPPGGDSRLVRLTTP